ncbi:MAG: isoprenylcysteine carboxylmethyltransferase family protein [Woeseiaceae bacterium]|nr:isoprenylcysteine carboxylmethyltransferase family protein [Woeseiaceae bacterium]
MTTVTRQQAVKTSAWLLYTLIVLEILFMVSPFAAYYYSIYATPLNALQNSPQTAWLTMYVLPHFTFTDSWLANGLILISWPMIFLGIVFFVVGFCQIYWSKFTRKGAVAQGLYRYIRHPQYIALIIIGLGASLYWSRFIIIIAFVSMLYIYVFLARVEERICLEKFGQSYREYMDRTGMFLPRRFEDRWRGLGTSLPQSSWLKGLVMIGIYALVLTLTIGAAQLLRGHVIDSLQIDDGEQRLTVFLAPTGTGTREVVLELVDDAELPGTIAYVAPASWRIPELGFTATADQNEHTGIAELLHPTTHGNPLNYAEDRVTILLADASTADSDVEGLERLTKALGIRPIMFIELDITKGAVIDQRPADEGQWDGIPVPTF